MKGGNQIGTFLKNNLFYIFAILLLFGFPFSESLISIATVILFFQLFLTGRLSQKWEILKTDRSLWMISGVYLIYLIGFIFCRDLDTGLYELNKSIFWVIVPVGVALSSRLTEKRFWTLLLLFIVFVTVSTFIAAYKIVNAEQFHITDIRDASYVSHVSFSFQIILSFFVLVYSLLKRPFIFHKIKPAFIVVWGVWLIFFLLFQKSLIGILSFYLSALIFAFWIFGMLRKHWHRRALMISVITLSLVPFLYVGYVAGNFYKVKDKMPSESEMRTINGNKYSFNFDNKQKENGHYVEWFICKKELEEAWGRRSKLSLYDEDATGYRVYYTLVRYLTSKGLKKDAEGVQALSMQDISNIENGTSNYIFVKKRYSLYPRIYQTIWEIDEYRNTGNPNNQSLSQRFEYMKAAVYIVKHNFWGIGTGNFRLEYAEAYEQINTKLKKEFRFHVHNQYLSYMVKFGIIGLLLIIAMITYSIWNKHQFRNILLLTLLIVMVVSNFGEAILETHVGLSFFMFFISLFLWHSPADLTNSMNQKKD